MATRLLLNTRAVCLHVKMVAASGESLSKAKHYAYGLVGTPVPNLPPPTILMGSQNFFGQNIPHKWMCKPSPQIFLTRFHLCMRVTQIW